MGRALNPTAPTLATRRRKPFAPSACEPAATFATSFEVCNLRRMNSADEQTSRRQTDKELVRSVERVEYAFLLRYPPYLHVRAEGRVDSEGWSDAELQVRVLGSGVSGGLLELDFVARPPAEADTNVSTLIQAEITWKEDVYQIHGVQVYSATGSMKKVFAEGSSDNVPPGTQR